MIDGVAIKLACINDKDAGRKDEVAIVHIVRLSFVDELM
jgi:hypothetical protein